MSFLKKEQAGAEGQPKAAPSDPRTSSGDVSTRYVPIDRVGPDYQPQTTSQTQPKVFATKRELDAYVRSVCKFIDYMVEGVSLVGLDTKAKGYVYEVYRGDSLDVAMQFLESIPLEEIPELHYIIVETPFGNVGKDLKGMFDE